MIGFPTITIAVFLAAVVGLLALDFMTHRKHEVVSMKSAVLWSSFYVICAMSFAVFLYVSHGKDAASLFLTGYALEKVLAFDNLFVFAMVFSYFRIPAEKQHAALYWGVAGAIVFRLIFVAIGVSSLELIGPVVELIFAVLILASIYMMMSSGADEMVNYDKTWYVRLIRKVYPGASIFFIAVVAIEISDIMFSFDSVPAIIAVTRDPLLIYSAMIFAILGLRSMYFIIAALARYFVYMEQAVILVLLFIAAKLIFGATLGMHVDPNIS